MTLHPGAWMTCVGGATTSYLYEQTSSEPVLGAVRGAATIPGVIIHQIHVRVHVYRTTWYL